MKNKLWIIISVILVLVIVAAVLLYPKLSEKYLPIENPDSQPTAPLVKTDDFTVYDKDVNEVKLSDNFGKPIVVNFWATWCGPCKVELPAFDRMYEKYGEDVIFMMVNLTDGARETKENTEKFVADNQYKFPVYFDLDYDAAYTYGVRSIPETLFINGDGSLYDARVGAMNETILEKYIQNIL